MNASADRVTAAVLVIGDEILSGRTQDTNLGAIAKYLAGFGVDLAEARVVADVNADIIAALNALRARYDYVITTGGIGPTHDDITADAVAEAFGVALHEHPEIIAMMAERWQGEVTPARRRMARIPEGGSLVKNPVSGPPGFQVGNVFVLAGVPTVMRGMLEDVGWRLKGGAVVVSRSLRVDGSGEGVIAAPLEAVAKAHPALSLGSYPFFGPEGYGSNLVIRGRDAGEVDMTVEELEAALRAAGIARISADQLGDGRLMLAYHPNGGAGERPTAETVWIDLLNPTEADIRLIEDHTGVRIPTHGELSEIERSSRLIVDGETVRLSAPMVANAETDHPSLSPVGMILTPKLLITVRFDDLKAFADAARRGCPEGQPTTAAKAFVTLLEDLVDREADLLELARAHLDEISASVFHASPEVLRAAMRSNDDLRGMVRKLGRIGERVSIIRESLLAVGRSAAFTKETAAGWLDADIKARLVAVGQDVDSLNLFDEHLSGKVQFLLDAALGLINIAQNDIFKVLTVASVVGIFPTLFVGWYGMNFHMPEYSWAYGYQWGIGVIVASTILPLAWFKWRGWF